MILPKTTDTLALQNALTPNVIAIPGNFSGRQSNTCQRQKGGTPYQLPNAVLYTPPCQYISFPPIAIGALLCTFGNWTPSSACFALSSGSTNLASHSTPPTTLLLPAVTGNPCEYSGVSPDFYYDNTFANGTCGGTPESTNSDNVTVAIQFDLGQAVIYVYDTSLTCFIAPLSSPPYNLSTPLVLTNTLTEASAPLWFMDTITLSVAI
jgi:hypothetical protein